MQTKLEEIAAKARQERKLVFTSIAHHITKENIWESLNHMPNKTGKGIDGVDLITAKRTFEGWSSEMIESIHKKSYKAPAVRRVWIPKPGKQEKRPIGVPAVADRALQRATAQVLNAIYEEDFLNCSFGGRPNRSAHNALATFNEVVSGKKVSWVFEADLKNFFGSLDHGWLLQFLQHRVGDKRIISLVQRWLKAGVMEDDNFTESEAGVPQGGSISVLLSNLYLHYVLDLWFEKIVKPKLKGESYLIRYIDDFIICFQYREDALQFQKSLEIRLAKFSLTLEPSKTRMVEFGRFATKQSKRWKEKLQTVYFLGFTHFCTRNQKGNFMVGRKTEKTRLSRIIKKVCDKIKAIRHWSIKDQMIIINQILRGHYNYYGMGGNYQGLRKVYDKVKIYWKKMLSTRSWKGKITWKLFEKIHETFPLLQPKVKISYRDMQTYAML